MMEDKNVTINVNGGIASFAKDNAIINVTQYNGISANELDHHHFTTIINSAPFAEQGILRLS